MQMSFPVLPHITASIPCSPMAFLSHPRHSSGGTGAYRLHWLPLKRVQAAHFGSLHMSLGCMDDSTWNSRDKAFIQETSEA